jgi:5,6-dimethylbenzimidazole synthase
MKKNKLFLPEDQKTLESIMAHRRDVRGNLFVDEEVSDEAVDKLLYAALQAPSVGYSQPWEFVVIRDDVTKKQIVDSFRCETEKAEALFEGQKRAQYAGLKLEGILEAPVNIAVFYKPSPEPVLGQTTIDEVGEYSVVCAVQNMWLMARAMNIGMGWVSILDPVAVKKILRAPEQNKLIAYLCVGHVREFLDKPELEILEWEKRKVLDSVVYNECYS